MRMHVNWVQACSKCCTVCNACGVSVQKSAKGSRVMQRVAEKHPLLHSCYHDDALQLPRHQQPVHQHECNPPLAGVCSISRYL